MEKAKGEVLCLEAPVLKLERKARTSKKGLGEEIHKLGRNARTGWSPRRSVRDGF